MSVDDPTPVSLAPRCGSSTTSSSSSPESAIWFGSPAGDRSRFLTVTAEPETSCSCSCRSSCRSRCTSDRSSSGESASRSRPSSCCNSEGGLESHCFFDDDDKEDGDCCCCCCSCCCGSLHWIDCSCRSASLGSANNDLQRSTTSSFSLLEKGLSTVRGCTTVQRFGLEGLSDMLLKGAQGAQSWARSLPVGNT